MNSPSALRRNFEPVGRAELHTCERAEPADRSVALVVAVVVAVRNGHREVLLSLIRPEAGTIPKLDVKLKFG
jgi:hypothetical protein